MSKRLRFIFLFLLFILSISIASNIYLIYQNMENYRVIRVVDGDSFDLKDGRRIRLLSLDAPEKGNCLYEESRERLKELILGKRVKLTDIIIDDYGRILANVFIANYAGPAARVSQPLAPNSPLYSGSDRVELGLVRQLADRSRHPLVLQIKGLFINKALIIEGLARFTYVSSPYYEEMKTASQTAKEEKRGIYSSLCRSTEPATDCNIKGNIRAGVKTYYLPFCKYYKQVIIDEAFGDKWFCNEEEAENEGFRKAGGC